jgi:Gpi18-like mannosyltransferase
MDIALTGVVVSHLSHFVSVLALYALSKTLFGQETRSQKAFCFISAALHTVSPAGAFLSAPYGEALFSCLNLTGFYCYVAAILAEDSGKFTQRDVNFLTAGCLFSLATSVRSNGILSGCLFLYDAVSGCCDFLSRGISLAAVRRMIFVVLGGSVITLGLVGPQYVAYKTYCADAASPRPWCEQRLPSVYGFVQAHYW